MIKLYKRKKDSISKIFNSTKEYTIYKYYRDKTIWFWNFKYLNDEHCFNTHKEWAEYVKTLYKPLSQEEKDELISYLEHNSHKMGVVSQVGAILLAAIIATFFTGEIWEYFSYNFTLTFSAIITRVIIFIFLLLMMIVITRVSHSALYHPALKICFYNEYKEILSSKETEDVQP